MGCRWRRCVSGWRQRAMAADEAPGGADSPEPAQTGRLWASWCRSTILPTHGSRIGGQQSCCSWRNAMPIDYRVLAQGQSPILKDDEKCLCLKRRIRPLPPAQTPSLQTRPSSPRLTPPSKGTF